MENSKEYSNKKNLHNPPHTPPPHPQMNKKIRRRTDCNSQTKYNVTIGICMETFGRLSEWMYLW